jgi:hypothetical protein
MTNPTFSQIIEALNTLEAGGLIKSTQWLQFQRKAEKLEKKSQKAARQSEVTSKVIEVLEGILSEEGSCTQHRAVWVAVGREDHTREEILTALQSLRSDGMLKSFKKSGNNFQVFWARAEEEATAANFDVNAAK